MVEAKGKAMQMGMGNGARRLVGALTAGLALSGCWTQIDGGPEQRRYNPHERGITAANVDTLAPVWTATEPGSVSEPVLAGGRVHVTRRHPVTHAIGVRTLDRRTGATVWDRTLLPSSQQPGILANPVVFSGGDLWTSYAAPEGAGLVHLDPATGATLGSELGELIVSPVVSGDGVEAYVQIGATFSDREVVVRDVATHTPLWTHHPADPDGGVFLAIADDRVYVATSSTLAALPAGDCGSSTCPPLWTIDLTDHTAGTGLLGLAVGPSGEVIVVTLFRWRDDPRHGVFPVDSEVLVYDGSSAERLWTGSVPSAAGGLAVDGRNIYVTTRPVGENPPHPARGTDAVAAFDLDGCGSTTIFCAPVWTAPLGSPAGSLLVGGDVVYTNTAGDLHALAAAGCGAATCEPLTTIEGAGAPRSIGEGQLYTTTYDETTQVMTLTALAAGGDGSG